MALNPKQHGQVSKPSLPGDWGDLSVDLVWLEQRASALLCVEMALSRRESVESDSGDGIVAFGLVLGVVTLSAYLFKT